MLGLGALGQYPLGGGPYGTATITDISWFEPYSDPVRYRRVPRAAVAVNNQVTAFNPVPVVSFGWMEELSKPQTLNKRALGASSQQFLAYQANPTTVTPFAWFASLSEPVRVRPALKTSLQQSFTADTTPIPITKVMNWFGNLSEPVRPKIGLAARLQQFFTAPPQLRPTPATSGVMNALETHDVFLGGATLWNAIQSGEVGVIVNNFTGGEIGISVPSADSPTGGVAGARVAISIS